MSLSNSIDLANAGDSVAIAWFDWQAELRTMLEAKFPYPTCNVIAIEQIFSRSASKKVCYMCGHKTTHRQTTGINFPPLAKQGWICEECDA